MLFDNHHATAYIAAKDSTKTHGTGKTPMPHKKETHECEEPSCDGTCRGAADVDGLLALE
jgi:hypothetical protein